MMMRRQVLVKGTWKEVAQAASDRGIDLTFRSESDRPEVIAFTYASHEVLAAWYQEDLIHEAPFPVGSLLWYSEERPLCKT